MKLEINPNEPVYVISVAAKLVGLHEQTLRLYEKKGLVKPKRTKKNTRLYSLNDLKKLMLIKFLTQEKGLNLNGVKLFLDYTEDIDKALERIKIKVQTEDKIGRADNIPNHSRSISSEHSGYHTDGNQKRKRNQRSDNFR